MKQSTFIITLAAMAVSFALLASGCVTKNKQVLIKSTTFGFKADVPVTTGGSTIGIMLGLQRAEYFSNPTSTNGTETAAPFNSTVHANIAALNQTADENFGTYQLPDAAYTQPNVSTTLPSIVTTPAATPSVTTTNK